MDFLLNLSLFQGISQGTRDKLLALDFRVGDYKSGELIHSKDTPIDEVGIVVQGSLKTTNYTIHGKELNSSYFFAVDAFPFYLLYAGYTHYPFHVYCFRKARTIWLKKKELLPIVEGDPALLLNILKFVANYTAYNKLLLGAGQYHRVQERLAYWLVVMSKGRRFVQIPQSQEVLSDLLMVNRSSLNQELKKLEELGVITVQGRNVYIEDPNYLDLLI